MPPPFILPTLHPLGLGGRDRHFKGYSTWIPHARAYTHTLHMRKLLLTPAEGEGASLSR